MDVPTNPNELFDKLNEPDIVDVRTVEIPATGERANVAVPPGAPELPNELYSRTEPPTAALVSVGPGLELIFGNQRGQQWAIAPENVADQLELPFPNTLRINE